MDRLTSLATFVEITESGSLASAAERLGQSPTMVAKHLKALEAHLGVRLLQRTTRRQTLTEAGAQYLERCKDILERMQKADEEAASQAGEPAGLLRVSAPISFGTTQLSTLISQYLAHYPKVNIELKLTDAPNGLLALEVDVAFLVGPLPDSSMVARTLGRFYAMVVCAAPSYLAQHGAPHAAQDLERHHCLGHTRWGPNHPWRFKSPDGPLEVAVNYRLHADHGPALRELALAGTGVILQPYCLVAADIAAGRLIRLLDDHDFYGRNLYLVYARDNAPPAKVKSFVEFALQKLHVPASVSASPNTSAATPMALFTAAPPA